MHASPDLLTYETVAAKLGVSPRTVRRYVAQKKLRATRMSRSVVGIRPADLAISLERRTA